MQLKRLADGLLILSKYGDGTIIPGKHSRDDSDYIAIAMHKSFIMTAEDSVELASLGWSNTYGNAWTFEC